MLLEDTGEEVNPVGCNRGGVGTEMTGFWCKESSGTSGATAEGWE